MEEVGPPLTAQDNVESNLYRVGEFVYLETKGAHPFLIRRIEEFIKNEGPMEARCTIVYRRRDISTAILRVADSAERNWPDYLVYDDKTGKEVEPRSKHNKHNIIEKLELNGHRKEANGKENGKPKEENDKESDELLPFDWGLGGLPYDANKLDENERYRLRQREVFLSRKEEKLNVNNIKGKCSVNLLCDVESSYDYLSRDDAYFYSLVYDNEKLSMLADKGAIRVGSNYQAVVPEFGALSIDDEDNIKCEEPMELDENKENGDLIIDEEEIEKKVEDKSITNPKNMELEVFNPNHGIEDKDLDRYLIHVRAIGVFARVIDPNSATKYPSSQMIAAVASKDSTMFYAFGLLHKSNYDIPKAQDFLVPPCDIAALSSDVDKGLGFNTLTVGGPLLVRDQLEEFSVAEAALFEDGLDKCGKDFIDIRCQLLPWKTLASLVEYYYLYKTTNRYIDGKKRRLTAEKENRPNHIYVPSTMVDSPAYIVGTFNTTDTTVPNEKGCSGCEVKLSPNFYKWGSRNDETVLCQECWNFWRRYGGLKVRTDMDHFDTDIAADPDIAQEMLKSLSYATPSFAKNVRDTKRFGANAYSLYTVVSASDLNMGGGGSINSSNNSNKKTQINMKTNLFTKMVRRALPRNILYVKKLGRSPFTDVNLQQISNIVNQMDQAKLCVVMKQIVAPNLNITPSTFQSLVAGLMLQFSAPLKRAASASLEGQPAPKRPAPTHAD